MNSSAHFFAFAAGLALSISRAINATTHDDKDLRSALAKASAFAFRSASIRIPNLHSFVMRVSNNG